MALDTLAPGSTGVESFAHAQSEGLSWSWYWDPAIFRLEQERIFRPSWQFAGLTTQIPEPGDFFTFTHAAQIPVIVVRDQDGQVKAFVNTCRHRGSLVVLEESGHRMTLQCPYHNWTYGLDGCLRRAPRSERNPDFTPEGVRLIELRTHAFGSLLFVNADPGARAFSDTFGGWMKTVEESGVDLDSVVRWQEFRTAEIASNWKILCENNFECYHCPSNHPTLAERLDVHADSWYELHDHFFYYHPREKTPADGAASGETDLEGAATACSLPRRLASFLWPNFIFTPLTAAGEGTGLLLSQIRPLDPERCLFMKWYCFSDEVDDVSRRANIDFVEEVLAEDELLCARAQRGISSRFESHNQLLLPSTERPLWHFEQLVRRALADALDGHA